MADCVKGASTVSIYEIRVKGRLDQYWATWFEGLTLAYEADTTVLRGALADEAALHGVLSKVGNLNLQLLSVNTLETSSAASGTTTAIDPSLVDPDAKAPNATSSDQSPVQTEVDPRKRRRQRRSP
jgi:hypothetical protein